jgi:CDGSH-type Zn-finger protein
MRIGTPSGVVEPENDVDSRKEIILFAASAGSRYKEHMSGPTIAQKSPIVQKVDPGTYYWCACGKSKSQPFCDGSHKCTGFAPVKTEITEARTVAWCGCKHTSNPCFCDGSHSKL